MVAKQLFTGQYARLGVAFKSVNLHYRNISSFSHNTAHSLHIVSSNNEIGSMSFELGEKRVIVDSLSRRKIYSFETKEQESSPI